MYNAIVAPDAESEHCARCARSLNAFDLRGAGRPVALNRVFGRVLGRVCNALLPSLWGGRIQLVIGHVVPVPGVDLGGSLLQPVMFWLVLDGTRRAAIEGDAVSFTEWRVPKGYTTLWTRRLQFNRAPCYDATDRYAPSPGRFVGVCT